VIIFQLGQGVGYQHLNVPGANITLSFLILLLAEAADSAVTYLEDSRRGSASRRNYFTSLRSFQILYFIFASAKFVDIPGISRHFSRRVASTLSSDTGGDRRVRRLAYLPQDPRPNLLLKAPSSSLFSEWTNVSGL